MNGFCKISVCAVLMLSLTAAMVWSTEEHECKPQIVYKIKQVPVPVPFTIIKKVPVIKEIKVPVQVPIKVPYPVKVPIKEEKHEEPEYEKHEEPQYEKQSDDHEW